MLSGVSDIEQAPNMEGRTMFMMLAPKHWSTDLLRVVKQVLPAAAQTAAEFSWEEFDCDSQTKSWQLQDEDS
jgi:hypothetical protein